MATMNFWDYIQGSEYGNLPKASDLNKGDYYAFGQKGPIRLQSDTPNPMLIRPEGRIAPDSVARGIGEAVPPVAPPASRPVAMTGGSYDVQGRPRFIAGERDMNPAGVGLTANDRLQRSFALQNPNALPPAERARILGGIQNETSALSAAARAAKEQKEVEDYRAFELKKAGVAAGVSAASREKVQGMKGEQAAVLQKEKLAAQVAMRDKIDKAAMERVAATGEKIGTPEYEKKLTDEKLKNLEAMRAEAELKAEAATTLAERQAAQAESNLAMTLIVEQYKSQADAAFAGLKKGEKPVIPQAPIPAGTKQDEEKVSDDVYNKAVRITESAEFKALSPAEKARVERVVKAWKKQNAI